MYLARIEGGKPGGPAFQPENFGKLLWAVEAVSRYSARETDGERKCNTGDRGCDLEYKRTCNCCCACTEVARVSYSYLKHTIGSRFAARLAG